MVKEAFECLHFTERERERERKDGKRIRLRKCRASEGELQLRNVCVCLSVWKARERERNTGMIPTFMGYEAIACVPCLPVFLPTYLPPPIAVAGMALFRNQKSIPFLLVAK